MMMFFQVDLVNSTQEEIDYLCSINSWLTINNLTKVYVVKENDDIKSVFCMNVMVPYIEFELTGATKEKERLKGYFEFGFKNILKEVLKDSSIKEIFICPINRVSEYLCKRYELLKGYSCGYYFENPNFNNKYEKLFQMLKADYSYEDLVKLCQNDNKMLKVLSLWYEHHSRLSKKLLKGCGNNGI